MSQYENLTDQQFLDFAKTVPARSDIVDLHDYVANVRALVAGDDPINIPESHLKLSRGENHEGSGRLNARIRQLSAWLSAASPRFSIRAAGVGTQVRRGASAQERFARGGEAQLAKGTSLNRWRQQFYRDIAESGVGVMQMNPRPGYYLYVRDHPDVMAEGSSLSEIMHMRRIDPAAVGYVSTDDGDVGLVVTQASRALGALAEKIAVDDMKRVLGFFDWGVELDPTRPEAWDPTLSVEVAEVWGPNNGALVVTGGNSSVATNRFGPSTQGRIIARWRHQWRRPPFYFATAGTTPYHSPLDEMVQLTAIRNFWATMLDLQASGAIFRHWQLVDINSGQDVTDRLPRDAAPEHLRYDLSKPPPNMGPGTEWKLAPFEFYDVTNRHAQVVAQHEAAGASVARLVGQAVNQNTPVGTADMINDSAREEFAEWIEAIEATIEDRWRDTFHYLKNHHSDPVWVHDQKRDTETEIGSFLDVAASVKAADITSEHVSVTLDTRNRMQKVADFRFAVEKISQGLSDFDREVEQGNIPGVDDADSEKAAIYVAEAERIEAQVELLALRQSAMQNAGLMPEQQQGSADPRFLQGQQTDPRGTGTGRGPNNISDTAMAAGASDTLRSA